jgi:hypothetical protein
LINIVQRASAGSANAKKRITPRCTGAEAIHERLRLTARAHERHQLSVAIMSSR